MDNFVIRKSNEQDFERVFQILRKSIEHSWSYDVFKEDFENENSLYFVLEINDYVVGYAAFKNVIDESTLMSIAIDNEYRRNGLGENLLLYSLNYLKRHEYKKVFLEVRETNEGAINLYKKAEFIIDGVRKKYYEDPVCDAIIMSKNL